MNYTQKTLIDILNTSIHKKKGNIQLNNEIDWKYMLQLSKEHNVSSLVYYGLKNSNIVDNIPSDIINEFKKYTFFTASHQIRHIKNIEEVLNLFHKNNIQTVVLKGLVVRSFYPNAEFRTMGDADIVVKKDNLEKSIDLLIGLGYKESARTNVDICFVKGDSRIELHWNLINQGRVNGGENFENNIWNELITVKVGDEDALSLNYEDLAVHLFVHLIKHLADKGCGIRHFCDIVLLLENKEDEINWDSFWSKINEYNLEKSTKIVFYICTEYLGMNIKYKVDSKKYINEKYLEMLLNDIMNHGVFGKNNEEETLARSVAFNCDEKKVSPLQQYLKVFFPPVKRLMKNYPYAEKYKILVPAAYIHRIIRCITNKEISNKDKSQFIFNGLSVIKERSPIIEWLEL